MQTPPSDPSCDLERGIALFHGGRLHDALEALGRASVADMGSPRPHVLMAMCLIRLNRAPEALAAANAALARDPESADAHRLASVALRRMRAFGPAMDAANAAVRVAPDDWRSHLAVAELANLCRDHTLAAQAIAAAGGLAPDQPAVMSAACVHAVLLRRWGEAETWATRQLAVEPDNVTALINLGVAQTHRSARLALDSYLAAARLDPQRPVLRKNLATCGLRCLWLLPPAVPVVASVVYVVGFSVLAGLMAPVAVRVAALIAWALVPVAILAWRWRRLPRPARAHLRRHWAEGVVFRPAWEGPRVNDEPSPVFDPRPHRG